MSAGHTINLIPKDSFYESGLGRFVKWATSVGRWIVVFTDLIVICSFLSRFYFDTKLADYYDEIKQKQAIVEATTGFEQSFRYLQKRITLIKTLSVDTMEGEKKTALINKVLPPDVSLTSLSFLEDKINLSGSALSLKGIATMLKGLLRAQEEISNINVSSLGISHRDNIDVINFTLSATWRKK